MKAFNQKLETWLQAKPTDQAGIQNIQIPGQSELLIWQTRYKVPSAYEADFVQHLIQAFKDGHNELSSLVTALNTQGFRSESGLAWTTQSFSDEMQRLGY